MIPLRKDLEKWLLHIYGEQQIHVDPNVVRLTEAVKLNRKSDEILSTFGAKEFYAVVGFIDMRGFSELSKNKSPVEVSQLVKPFLQSIIGVAGKNYAFIDKSIGDEVMIVMPSYGSDVLSSKLDIRNTERIALLKPYKFLADLITDLLLRKVRIYFTAGFALGRLFLDKIGSDHYSEWTCYGNCVNAAKRLQSQASLYSDTIDQSANTHAIGAIITKMPDIEEELKTWMTLSCDIGPVRLHQPILKTEELKGVGKVGYLVSGVRIKD